MTELAIVDALARLQLAAKLGGLRIEVVDAPDDVRELIELCGLTTTLRVEPRRQPEEREQRLGVEEERELADPPA